MKKVFFSLLAALLLVSLVACTTKEKEMMVGTKTTK